MMCNLVSRTHETKNKTNATVMTTRKNNDDTQAWTPTSSSVATVNAAATENVTTATSSPSWPEDEGTSRDYSGSSPSSILRRWSYSYMNGILKKGASIHRHTKRRQRRRQTLIEERERRLRQNGTSAHATDDDFDLDEIDAGDESVDVQQQLTHADLYATPICMRAAALQPKFNSIYNAKEAASSEAPAAKSKRKRKNPNKLLTSTLWTIASPTFIPAGFCQLLTVVAQVSIPLFVWRLLRILEENPAQSVFVDAIPYVISIFIMDVLNAYGTHRQKYLALRSGVTLRVSLLSAIYERVLQLTPEGRAGLTTGSIANLFAIDVQKLFEVTAEGHLLWSAPLSMVLVAIALCVVVGPSMAVGIASLILFAPVIQRITNKMMEIRKQRVKVTDKRVEIVNAMLQGIKVTKLNNYESRYIERMKEIRREELMLLRKELYVWSTVMAVQFISPVLASAGAFTAYVLLGNLLTTADAFTALLLFNALRFPINYASRLVGKVAQARESARRIAIFMRREIRSIDDSDREIGSTSNKCNGDSGKKLPSHILAVDRDEDCTNGVGNIDCETSSTSEERDSSRGDSISHDKDPLLVVKDGVFRIGATSSFVSSEGDEQTCGLGSNGSYTIRGVNVSVRPGEILAIVGPVGSGKSTIINAIIGEVSVSPSTSMVRRGKVAYASQVAFILNSTVRENILFGSTFDAARYNQVLDACCLREDIAQLSHGDLTEIGERGVTLSGGQKQRVSLARVVYSNPDIALFDDPLSALDAGTARMVFERLFEQSGNKLLANTATVLVTHASHFLNRVSEIMVVVDGSIPFCGHWDKLMEVVEENPKAKLAIDSIRTAVQEDGNEQESTSGLDHSVLKNTKVDEFKKMMMNDNAADVLMTTETREHGLTQIWAWLLWFQQGGGTSFTVGILFLFVFEKLFYFGTEWWIAFWTHGCNQPMQALGISFPPQSDGVPGQYGYLLVYGILLVLAFICAFARTLWIVTGGIRCSKNLYEEMTAYVLHAPMSFFETTPMGRLLNRFTYDAEILDVTLVWSMSMLLIALSWFLTALVVMLVILPWMILVMLPVSFCYWSIQIHYRKSGADLHRLDALSRSPLQAMLSEGIEGAATIRTFHKEDTFISRFRVFADKNTSAQMNFLSAQRWLGIRIELLGAVIVFIASIIVIGFNGTLGLQAGLIALLIRWSSGLTVSLSFLVDNVAEAEGAVTAIERISRMTDTPQEPDFDKKGDTVVDPSWPTKGELEFHDVKMRYRPRLPLALNGLSFRVEAGQHCGVVGRTGAGKSTLATALFRLVEIESGRISVDNVNLSKLGLSDIRGRPNGIAIIPQDPFLFAGTLRECLDPFGNSSDEKLLDALASVRMLSSGRGIEYLDSRVEEGGANYSVGERSLLVLARAILAKPKLLLMDEATANIDGETDSFIQKMLRTRFRSTTLLTIAHRLDTIMDYDKILVMADGKLAEFGSPVELIEENGLFRELVDATGEGAASLIQMARSAAEEKERERQDRGLFA
eukprot:scaffold67_cov155-Skeletonema_menzelii.AAC.24